MTSAPSWARARETTTCSALAGCSGCSSGHSPSTSRAVLAPVRRSPASSASRLRSRGLVISWPRKATRDSSFSSVVTRPAWPAVTPSGHEDDAPVAAGLPPGLLGLGQGHGVDGERDLAGGDLLEQAAVGGRGILEWGLSTVTAAEQLDGRGPQRHGRQGRHLAGGHPDQDVADRLGAWSARPSGWISAVKTASAGAPHR